MGIKTHNKQNKVNNKETFKKDNSKDTFTNKINVNSQKVIGNVLINK